MPTIVPGDNITLKKEVNIKGSVCIAKPLPEEKIKLVIERLNILGDGQILTIKKRGGNIIMSNTMDLENRQEITEILKPFMKEQFGEINIQYEDGKVVNAKRTARKKYDID